MAECHVRWCTCPPDERRITPGWHRFGCPSLGSLFAKKAREAHAAQSVSSGNEARSYHWRSGGVVEADTKRFVEMGCSREHAKSHEPPSLTPVALDEPAIRFGASREYLVSPRDYGPFKAKALQLDGRLQWELRFDEDGHQILVAKQGFY